MKYQDQLNPWVIHKFAPNLQRATIARFRHRNEAEGHLKLMRQMQPHLQFAIAFEVREDQPSDGSSEKFAEQVPVVG